MSEILEALGGYEFFSPIDTVEKINGGNVNVSYKITSADGEKYVLQKINRAVFPDVDALMENVLRVTEKLSAFKAEKTLDKMRVLNIKFTREGRSFLKNANGCYRVYDYVKNSASSVLRGARASYGAGNAFGNFITIMNTEPLPQLNCVLKDYHNAPARLARLAESYKKAPFSRKNKAKEVAEYLFSKERTVRKFHSSAGSFPKRIIHNDTKINNVIFDAASGEAVGVFDLDTVSYGLISDDFGDGTRSIAGPEKEDENDLEAACINAENYFAFADGFLSGVSRYITDGEREILPRATLVITLELAARFLTDYLEGDAYFRTEYPEQNLARAKCQAALAKDVEKRLPDIKKRLKSHVNYEIYG